ncbi:MAG: hypothetical protein ACTSYO_06200 [Candidatus Ranarchaeia archaeon]
MPKQNMPLDEKKLDAKGSPTEPEKPKNKAAVGAPKKKADPAPKPLMDYDEIFNLVKSMERVTTRIEDTINKVNARLEDLEKIVESLTKKMEESESHPDPLKTQLNQLSSQLLAQTLAALQAKYPSTQEEPPSK